MPALVTGRERLWRMKLSNSAMSALMSRPVLDLNGEIILDDDDRLYRPIRRVTPPRGRRLLIAPAVLLGLAAALVLRQPSDQAGEQAAHQQHPHHGGVLPAVSGRGSRAGACRRARTRAHSGRR